MNPIIIISDWYFLELMIRKTAFNLKHGQMSTFIQNYAMYLFHRTLVLARLSYNIYGIDG